MTKSYDEVITYNDGRLITKINILSEDKESLICPPSLQPTTTKGYTASNESETRKLKNLKVIRSISLRRPDV